MSHSIEDKSPDASLSTNDEDGIHSPTNSTDNSGRLNKRRQRSCNFSNEEIDVLINHMKVHCQDLYGTQMNRRAKTRLWEKITDAVNVLFM